VFYDILHQFLQADTEAVSYDWHFRAVVMKTYKKLWTLTTTIPHLEIYASVSLAVVGRANSAKHVLNELPDKYTVPLQTGGLGMKMTS
jgi:hypothetical protein